MQQEQGERKRNLDETIKTAKEQNVEERKRALKKRSIKRKITDDLINERGKSI